MMNNLMNEDLARAEVHARLGEAQQLRRGRRHVAARRLSRKAEEAARQAQLAWLAHSETQPRPIAATPVITAHSLEGSHVNGGPT